MWRSGKKRWEFVMALPCRIVIFVQGDGLKGNKRHNPLAREDLLRLVADRIQTRFPTIKLGEPLVSSMSVAASVPKNMLPDLIEFIDENKFGRIQYDGEILVAARS
jgi:hypothetical protein